MIMPFARERVRSILVAREGVSASDPFSRRSAHEIGTPLEAKGKSEHEDENDGEGDLVAATGRVAFKVLLPGGWF